MESVNEFKDRMTDSLEEAKAALAKSKEDMALYYNRKCTPAQEFKAGDMRVADDGSSLKLKDLETWIRNGGILIPQSSNLKGKAKASSSSPTKPEDGGGSDVAKKSKKKKKLDSVAR